MPVFQSPNICRDLSTVSEFKTLADIVRDDFGHKMVEVKKVFREQKKSLTGFRVSPVYKSMLMLFCPDVVSISMKNNEPLMIYGLPVIEDEGVSCIQFEFKEKGYEESTDITKIENSDLVITINSKSGKLISPQTCVYIKDKNGLSQIGLIQSLEIHASINSTCVDMRVEFPSEIEGMSPSSKESLRKNIALLSEKGCQIKQTNNKE